MLGDREPTAIQTQGVTVPRGHGKPALGIEIERGSTLKHCDQSLEDTFHHLIALFSTLSGKQHNAMGLRLIFCNEINHLAPRLEAFFT
jgi:hypothetical protein